MQASLMRRYDAGQTIFKDGDPVDAFYVITRGSCEVRGRTPTLALPRTRARTQTPNPEPRTPNPEPEPEPKP
jgi:hypothetical protein